VQWTKPISAKLEEEEEDRPSVGRQPYLKEGLADEDIVLGGPQFEVKTYDRFRLKTIIRLSSVVLVRCRRLQDLLVLQGTTKSTRKESQL